MQFDMKWIALFALVLQNSGLAMMMRLTLINTNPDSRYCPSTAVLAAEILKIFISLFACYFIDANGSYTTFRELVQIELLNNKIDWLKLTIPSLLYTLQNSIQYFSMSLLSAPVFQVLYQMKIITTALFSVVILQKRIGAYQWLSVIALAGGVALVQLSQLTEHGDSKSNSLIGLISVLFSCVTSGFAGVYFESVLKNSKASIWIRNIQLSLIGIILSLVSFPS